MSVKPTTRRLPQLEVVDVTGLTVPKCLLRIVERAVCRSELCKVF